MPAGATVAVTPELVEMILKSLFPINPTDRLSYLLVNRFWLSELSRHLWKECGGFVHNFSKPLIAHLAILEPDTQQKYANLIKSLIIGNRSNAWIYAGFVKAGHPDSGLQWEGTYFEQLKHLRFPRLQNLKIEGPCPTSVSANTTIPAELLPTQLTSLVLDNIVFTIPKAKTGGTAERYFLIVPDTFWSVLSNQCKSLTQLRILNTLGSEIPGCASIKLFQEVTEIRSLRGLELPGISASWLNTLPKDPINPPLFANLRVLAVGLSSTELEKLVPHLATLQCIYITIKTAKNFSLAPLARLPMLVELWVTLKYSGTTVNTADLLAISAANPNLRKLFLKDGKCRGLSDQFVKELSANLPLLDELSLDFFETTLTINALISLGLNCPHLKTCYLPLARRSVPLHATPATVSWPNLECLWTKRDQLKNYLALELRPFKDNSMPMLRVYDNGWNWIRHMDVAQTIFSRKWF